MRQVLRWLLVAIVALALRPTHCTADPLPARFHTGNGTYALAANQFDSTHDAAVAQNPAGVTALLSLDTNQATFHPGERIPIKLTLSSTTARYRADTYWFDRESYFERDDVYFADIDGAADPAPDYYDMRGSGAYDGRGPQVAPLTTSAQSLNGDLNPWLRFTKPGTYRIYVVTTRVSADDTPATMGIFQPGSKIFPVTSNILPITILAVDPGWSSAAIASAKAKLALPSNPFPNLDAQFDGARTLRYLGTPPAVRALIDNMSSFTLFDVWNSLAYAQTRFAMYEAVDHQQAYSALEHFIASPNLPVRDDVLWTAAKLKGYIDNDSSSHPVRPFIDEHLSDSYHAELKRMELALNSDIAHARGATLCTLLMNAEMDRSRARVSTSPDCDRLAAALATRYRDLPVDEATQLLDPDNGTWDDIARQRPIPLLKYFLANPKSTQDLRSEAAARLMEAVPAEGRAVILADINSPSPTLSLKVLDSLPDATLPGIDRGIADRVLANKEDLDVLDMDTALLARYGTSAILPDMETFAQPYWGTWACRPQTNMLAYFLRVDPNYGARAFQTCLASRKHTGCFKMLFTDVGDIYPCERLQRPAIDAMHDPSADVTSNAIQYLGKQGNNDALLRERLTDFNATQPSGTAGAQSVGQYSFSVNDIGNLLVNSIARNPDTLYGQEKLTQLQALCKTAGELGALKAIRQEQGDLSRIDYDGAAGWRFGQYGQLSRDQVERLAGQLPKGSTVAIGCDSAWRARVALDEAHIRWALAKHGIVARIST